MLYAFGRSLKRIDLEKSDSKSNRSERSQPSYVYVKHAKRRKVEKECGDHDSELGTFQMGSYNMTDFLD